MSLQKDTKRSLIVLTIIAIIAFVILLKPNLTVIVFAGLIAHFVRPVYRYLTRVTKSTTFGLILTRIAIILGIIIPVIVVSSLLVHETTQIYQDLITTQRLDQAQARIVDHLPPNTETMLETYLNTNTQSIKNTIINGVKNIATTGTKRTATIGSSLMWLVTSIILFAFVLTALLTKKKPINEEIHDIVPMEDKIVNTYIQRLTLMASSMVRSTFLIALIQWLATGLSLRMIGVPYPLFFTFLASILGIIPMVGAAFVAMPIGVILLIMGDIRSWVFIILFNQVIVNNIDNILRPRLVDKQAQIDNTLLILSLFGGMAYRGVMGILYGPLLMSFILTTIEIAKEKKILH